MGGQHGTSARGAQRGFLRLLRPARRGADADLDVAHRLAVLEACDLFAELPRAELERLASGALRMSLEPGQQVVLQDDNADALFVVLDGRLTVTTQDEAVGELPDLVAGDYFGEIGLLESLPRTATVTTAVTTVLLRFDHRDFMAAVRRGRASPSLLARVAARLDRTGGRRGL